MSEVAASGGYVSEQSKRAFTIWAGVLGVAFFVVQMFAPMIAMLAIMPGFFFNSEVVSYDCCSGQAYVAGQLYLVEKATSAGFHGQKVRTRLVRLEGRTVRDVAPLGEREPSLIATPDGLLLITSGTVGRLEGHRLVEARADPSLGSISPPFLFEGLAGVVEYLPDRRRLMVWNGTEWRELRSYPNARGPRGARFLGRGDQLLEFRGETEVLYFRELDGEGDWEVVSSKASDWSALLLDGRPAVVVADDQRLHLYERSEGGWREERSTPLPGGSSSLLEAFPGSPGGSVTVVTSRFAGNLRVGEWGETGFEEKLRVGGANPFPGSMIAMMWVAQAAPALLSLVLAVVLSALMRTHRVGETKVGDRVVAYASLTRRALAQLVDGAVAFAPLAVVGTALVRRLEDLAEGPEIVVWIFGGMAAVLVWMLLVLVVFSVGEGRWGLTPGKWVTGIRVVGTDLSPCGFGRALVRNLLKMVDGFFNYLIGILMVAFTPEWQRLGDLAARTIVIRGDALRTSLPEDLRAE